MSRSHAAEAPDSSGRASMRGRLLLLLGERRRLVAGLAFLSIVSSFLEAGTLAIIALIAVALVPGAHGAQHTHNSLFDVHASTETLLIVAFVLVVLRLFVQIPLSIMSSRITADVLANTRERLFNAFTIASWGFQSRDREGYLQETLTGQSLQASGAASQTISLITSSFQFGVLIFTALVLNALAALVVGILSLVLFAVLRPLRASGVRNAHALSAASVRYASGIAEVNRLTEETHVFGVFAAQRRRVGELIAETHRFFFRSQLISRMISNVYTSLIYLLLVCGLAGLYLIGGRHAGSLGGVVLLLLRAGTAGQGIQSAYQSLAQSMPFVERTQETTRRYGESAAVDGSEALSAVRTIAFDDVSFAYNPGQPVLSDVSFEVDAGESIGIVGPSGAGKSTVVQILLGLRPPGEGHYLVNGVDADRYRLADWHRQVSYVPQEPRLLHASVTDNIRFFRDISDEEVQRAARLARIHDDIMRWSAGYQTIVGPRADAVSGGQQQRICLARALAARPAVLVLDEPTSALDPHSEALIGESLIELTSDLTLFVVAHRMSTLEMCDRVMVVMAGRLVGFDTRAHLLRENPYYRSASALAVGGGSG